METSSKLIVTCIGFGVLSYIHDIIGSIMLDMGTKWTHLAHMFLSYTLTCGCISLCLLVMGALIKIEQANR